MLDSLLGCAVPDGKLQKTTNVNETAKCVMSMEGNKSNVRRAGAELCVCVCVFGELLHQS